MNHQHTANPMLARSPEPFEEVWMYPEGWDLSEMEKAPASAAPIKPEAFPVDHLLLLRTGQSV